MSGAAFAAFCLAAVLRLFATRSFDFPLIRAVNTVAHRSRIFDYSMQMLAGFDLFQGLPLVGLACGAAVSLTGRSRVRLAVGIIAAGMASLLSRLVQYLLPNVPRPVVDPALDFRRPYGGHPEFWRDWSSFPSDHATLLWGMAFAIFIVSPRIGALSVGLATTTFLARLYCGLHYVTDTVGGAMLGLSVVCGLIVLAAPWEDRLLAFGVRRPALIASVGFVFAAQTGTFFYDLRTIAASTARHVVELQSGQGE